MLKRKTIYILIFIFFLNTSPTFAKDSMITKSWAINSINLTNNNIVNSKIGIISDGINNRNKTLYESVENIYNPVTNQEISKKYYKYKNADIGTGLASILASNNQKNKKIIDKMKLYIVDFTDNSNNDKTLASSIQYLLNNKVDIIIIALGIYETLLEGEPLMSCELIKKAKLYGIPTVVSANNSESVSNNYTYDLKKCDDVVIIGGYDQNLANIDNIQNYYKEFLAAPASNILITNNILGFNPTFSSTRGEWALSFFTLGYLIVNNKNKDMNISLKDLLKYSYKNIDGRNLLDIKASYNKLINNSFIDNHNKLLQPEIVEYVRDDRNVSVSWRSPSGLSVEKFIVELHYYKNSKWSIAKKTFSSNSVRGTFDIILPNKNFVIVSAVDLDNNVFNSTPYYNLDYKPYINEKPTDFIISNVSLEWNDSGILINYSRNYENLPLDIILLDKNSNKVLRKYSTYENKSFTIPIDKDSYIRELDLVVATGIGKIGIDTMLYSFYDYKITVSRVDDYTIVIKGIKLNNELVNEGEIYKLVINNNDVFEAVIDNTGGFTNIINYSNNKISINLVDRFGDNKARIFENRQIY